MKRLTRGIALMVAMMLLMTTAALASTEIISEEFTIRLTPAASEDGTAAEPETETVPAPVPEGEEVPVPAEQETEQPEENGAPAAEEINEEGNEPAEEKASGLDLSNVYLGMSSNKPAGELKIGEEWKLYAEVSGLEGFDWSIQWQRSDDGVNWTPVQNEVGLCLTVVVTEENMYATWRYVVDINEAK